MRGSPVYRNSKSFLIQIRAQRPLVVFKNAVRWLMGRLNSHLKPFKLHTDNLRLSRSKVVVFNHSSKKWPWWKNASPSGLLKIKCPSKAANNHSMRRSNSNGDCHLRSHKRISQLTCKRIKKNTNRFLSGPLSPKSGRAFKAMLRNQLI